MMDVTVKIPVDRIGEFYSVLGTWLSTSPQLEAVAEIAAATSETWAPDDDDTAALLWSKLSPTARRLFSVLIDNPGRQFGGDELAGRSKISNGRHGVAGVLAWPGRHCVAVGRPLFWEWNYPVDGGPAVYSFTPEMADLFRRVR